MTEKSSTPNTTLIIAAAIGALGGILAACIGLIPAILPIVRPSPTPLVFISPTPTITDTPQPTPPTETPTFTEMPTLTDTPSSPPTETSTTVPTPVTSSSNIDDYVGTWINTDPEPGSEKVQLIVTRIEVAKTSDLTADFSVCRAGDKGEIYVLPNPSVATMYAFGLAARDFIVPRFGNLRWAIIAQRSGEKLVITVQEYDVNNVLLNSDTFQLEKPSLLASLSLGSCDQPLKLEPTPVPATDTLEPTAAP